MRVERGRSPMDLLKTSPVSWNKVLQSLSVFTGPLFWDRDSSVSETQGQTFDNMKDITLTTFVTIHPSTFVSATAGLHLRFMVSGCHPQLAGGGRQDREGSSGLEQAIVV